MTEFFKYYLSYLPERLGRVLAIALPILVVVVVFWELQKAVSAWGGDIGTLPYGMALSVIGALALGGLVGASELISRYTDEPGEAMKTAAGVLYITVNAAAAAAAFAAVHGFDLLGLGTKPPLARVSTEVVVAGLSAMAIFRAAVFTMRVGDTDVPVGPAGVLQVIVNAVDRAVDRDRAEPRARLTSTLMSGISWEAAADILPQFCFDSMQNVSAEERQRLLEWVDQLKTKQIAPEQKTLLLGLRLLNIVGERVLRSTIHGLGTRIRAPLQIGVETLGMLRRVNFEVGGSALIAICYAIALGDTDWRGTADARGGVEAVAKEIGQQPYDNEVKVLLLAAELLKRFGEETLASALELADGSLSTPPARPADMPVISPLVVVPGAIASSSIAGAPGAPAAGMPGAGMPGVIAPGIVIPASDAAPPAPVNPDAAGIAPVVLPPDPVIPAAPKPPSPPSC